MIEVNESLSPIGEVIAAATTAFMAQCLETPRTEFLPTGLPDPPPLGAFVCVGSPGEGASSEDPFGGSDDTDPFAAPSLLRPPDNDVTAVYGVVVYSEIGALEAGRPLTAFGLSEEELRVQQPHLYELLAARFTAALVGYACRDNVVRAALPPRPPRPHSQVRLATERETRDLTIRLDFLRALLSGSAGLMTSFPADDVIAELLRRAAFAHGTAAEIFLLRAGRELAALLPNDYDRLRAIIGRIAG